MFLINKTQAVNPGLNIAKYRLENVEWTVMYAHSMNCDLT